MAKRTVSCLVSSIYRNIVGHSEYNLTSDEVMSIHKINRSNGFFYNSITKRYEPVKKSSIGYVKCNKSNNLEGKREELKQDFPRAKRRLVLKENKKQFGIKVGKDNKPGKR